MSANTESPVFDAPIYTEPGQHYHCPQDCEHPQPFRHPETGKILCGVCWFRGKIPMEVFLCTPETCPEDG